MARPTAPAPITCYMSNVRPQSEGLSAPTTCVKSALSVEKLENALGAGALVNWRRNAPVSMSRPCFTVWK